VHSITQTKLKLYYVLVLAVDYVNLLFIVFVNIYT